MPSVKYQVFISSTFKDLVQERKGITEAILDLDHIPSGMELFPAADQKQMEYIKQVIDECDYYVLVLGGRYGSADASGISYTEQEYDYAFQSNKCVLAFLHHDIKQLIAQNVDTDPKLVERLNAFRIKVGSGRLVKEWRDNADLKAQVITALVAAFKRMPGVGWVRGDQAASDATLTKMNELLVENEELRRRLSRSDTTTVYKNIADLNDTILLSVRGSRQNAAFRDYNVKISLLDLFVRLAQECVTPIFASHADKYIKEVIVKEEKITHLEMAKDECNKVKYQLDALGLIKLYVPKNTRGGSQAMQTTEAGKKRLYDAMLVKKAS